MPIQVFLLHKYPDENSNTSWAYGDKYDETARIAFRAALVLEDIPPSAKDMTEQDMPVDRLRRASRERYNVTWTTPPLRLMPTYEAIMVLGSVSIRVYAVPKKRKKNNNCAPEASVFGFETDGRAYAKHPGCI
ncbi:hypothetical protein RvY_11833 [Ramazzottius varieornatus]|uniref:Uncharacterized protein n=1 Tax=Ramazzottius varieornatus TaxID=947166 RepID=A0A1D1VJU3_RAMVA|nr:hypothetical protein RvY_11833 [Ramazzottius varieornatus]